MKIGIDLGTTNSALAYIDERETEDRDFPPVHIFETPQLVAAGRVEPRRTLPSFLFLEDAQPVGLYAREQGGAGAYPPGAFRQNRGSPIRMWTAPPRSCRGIHRIPAACSRRWKFSARFIGKFREEWDRAKGAPLAQQDIVLTVPASFDEEARELTVMAARDAGLNGSRCSKEPAAAFYSLDRQQPGAIAEEAVRRTDRAGVRRRRRHQRLQPDPRFAEGDLVNFTRTAVGKHLLLGGDNLDFDARLVGRDQAGRAAFHPPA